MTPSQTLFPYGIQTEESDLRAHVCPKVRRVYVYPTPCGVKALGNGHERPGYQPGVDGATANGRCVKPFDIERCVELRMNERAWEYCRFSPDDDTSSKGNKAVLLVSAMLKAGLFPLPFGALVDSGVAKSIQIKGDDIYVWTAKQRLRIQVKCDFRGGDASLGGTGFLYLQTAERNPLKRI